MLLLSRHRRACALGRAASPMQPACGPRSAWLPASSSSKLGAW